MKFKITMAAMLSLILSGFMTLTVHAESGDPDSSEPVEYQWYINYTQMYDYQKEQWDRECTFSTNERIGYLVTGTGNILGFNYEPEEVKRVVLIYYNDDVNDNTLHGVSLNCILTIKDKYGVTKEVENRSESFYLFPYEYNYPFESMGYCYFNFETNIPIFNSPEDLKNYLLTGDASAALNNEKLKQYHNFTADTYTKDIPVPELRLLSYDGFTVVNNEDNEYYIDIVIKTKFFGVKLEKQIMTWFPVADKNWVYALHYYNLADSGLSRKMNKVDFPSQYGISIQNDLANDFKKWSMQYPTVNKLPDYSRFKHIDDRLYKVHLYGNPEDKETEHIDLGLSDQAQITYYLRFRNDDGDCGQWVMYEYGSYDKVVIGESEVDENGNFVVDEEGMPVVKNTLTGRQDGVSGDVNLSSGSLFGFDILEFFGLDKVGEMFDYIRSTLDKATASIGSFGALISACLSFLPQELIGFIVLGIVLMIFVGIIKVVMG